MIIIDDAAGMIKYIWEDLDIIVIGGSPLMILKMETVEANTRAANKGVSTMTQFKEGDEVLVKAKFLCGSEDWYYDSSKQKMYYDKAVLTFDYEIDGYFAPCVKDLIPASALDVNKQLLAENNRLREENYDLTLTFLLLKEKQDAEIERLRKILEDVLETSGEQIPYGMVKAMRTALKEKE